MNENILLVDDDVNALSGYVRNLRSKFKVQTATSGKEALELIKNSEPFAVVVSDFKMPEMDGNKFLATVRTTSPDTVRIMLTGYADAQTAITAVNEGNIFRLLTKPCSIEDFVRTLNDAVGQYRLINAEKELLDKTLKGSINVLTDILSIVSPIAFSQTARIRNLTKNIAEKLGIEKTWEVEIATLLSQIGCITVPTEILEKKFHNLPLTKEEDKIFDSHPQTGQALLKNIPRLEEIAEAISLQLKSYETNNGENIPIISRILKVVIDYDLLTLSGKDKVEAIATLRQNSNLYDPNVLAILDFILTKYEGKFVLKTASTIELEPGMIIAEDIKDRHGYLLLSKGLEVSEVLKIHLMSYEKMKRINGVFKVLVRLND